MAVDYFCLNSGARVCSDRPDKGCLAYHPVDVASEKSCSHCLHGRQLMYDGSVNLRHLAEYRKKTEAQRKDAKAFLWGF